MKTTEAHMPRFINSNGTAHKNVATVRNLGLKCIVEDANHQSRLCHHLQHVLPGKTMEETMVQCCQRGLVEGTETDGCPSMA